MEDLYELALFAGAGGGLLASKLLGWRTVCYVEWNSYAVEILKARMRDGYLDDAPIWDNCFSFDGAPWAGLVDVITAGFPCQPFSSAGKGLAESDPRNGWPAVKRIIGEVRPGFAFLENVPGLISKPYIRRIFGDLAEIGYDAEWGTLSAAAVGANHKRERLWIVAYNDSSTRNLPDFSREFNKEIFALRNGKTLSMANTNQVGRERQSRKYMRRWEEENQSGEGSKEVPDAECLGMEEPGEKKSGLRVEQSNWWSTEPRLGRVAHGVAHRMDRLEALGNGQVPEVARTALKLLMSRIIG